MSLFARMLQNRRIGSVDGFGNVAVESDFDEPKLLRPE